MARYFFHLDECGSVTPDPEGTELPNLDAAREYATREARIMMCEELRGGALCLSCRIDITGEDGAALGTVLFSDTVVVTGMPAYEGRTA